MRGPRALVASAAVLAIYSAAFAAMPPGAFYSPDEGTKYLQLRSIGWRDGIAYAVPYGGAALDPDYAYYPTHCRHQDLYPIPLPGGGVRFHWPIWFSLITSLPAELFGLRGLYVIPLLSGWLTALLCGRLAAMYDRRLAPLAIVAAGLATPLAFFSLTYWEHTLAALLGIGAVTLIAARSQHAATAWLASTLLVAAVCLRLELVPFALAIALAWWLARRATASGGAHAVRRARGWLAAYAIAIAGALLAASAFMPFRHAWVLSELHLYALGTLAKLPHLAGALVATLIDARGHSAPDLPAWLRAGALVAFAAAAAAAFLRPARFAAAVAVFATLAALTFSALVALLPAPYMSVHGLLPVAPFVILAAWAVPEAIHGGRFDRLFLAYATGLYAVLGFALLFTFTFDAGGAYRTGLEWGNRYLLLLYPLGAVLALAGFQSWRRAAGEKLGAIATAIAVGLVLCGLQMEARGLWVLYRSRALVAEWQAALTGEPVVTDVWWLPAAMAPYFADRPMFCVRDRAELAAWMDSAHGRGADAFTVATFRDLAPPTRVGAPFAVVDVGRVPVTGLRLTRYRFADEHN